MFLARKQKSEPVALVANAKEIMGLNADVTLNKVDLVTEVIDCFAIMTLRQTYTNNSKEALDVEYSFPVLAQSCLLEFLAETDDQVYKGTVELKQKVEQRVKELHAAAVPTITAEHTQDKRETVKLSIGNMQPEQQITVSIKMSTKIEAVTSSGYRLIIPIVLMERLPMPTLTGDGKVSASSTQERKTESKFQLTPSSPFTFKVIINKDGFHDVLLVHMNGISKDEYEFSSTEEQAVFRLKDSIVHYPTTDIAILYRRESREMKAEKINTSSSVPQYATLYKVSKSADLVSDGSFFPACAYSNFMIAPNGKN